MSTRPARDFEAEHAWLHRLPPGPETSRKQDEWSQDPDVRVWQAKQRLEEAKANLEETKALIPIATEDFRAGLDKLFDAIHPQWVCHCGDSVGCRPGHCINTPG